MTTLWQRIEFVVRNPRKAQELALQRSLTKDRAVALALGILHEQYPDLVLRIERDGTHWTLPLGDEIPLEVLREGHYEGDGLDGLLARLRSRITAYEEPVVIDVGDERRHHLHPPCAGWLPCCCSGAGPPDLFVSV